LAGRHTNIYGETNKQIDIITNVWPKRNNNKEMDRQIDTFKDIQAGRQIDSNANTINRQRDRIKIT
jgi:hypothetical protein